MRSPVRCRSPNRRPVSRLSRRPAPLRSPRGSGRARAPSWLWVMRTPRPTSSATCSAAPFSWRRTHVPAGPSWNSTPTARTAWGRGTSTRACTAIPRSSVLCSKGSSSSRSRRSLSRQELRSHFAHAPCIVNIPPAPSRRVRCRRTSDVAGSPRSLCDPRTPASVWPHTRRLQRQAGERERIWLDMKR